MSDDAELLRRYAEQRSEAAFAELVRRHLNLVYSAAVRLTRGDTHRAEDVAQLVFTDLARKAAALARRPVLAGWLYTSTHYATAKILRTEQRRQTREQEAQAMQELLSSPAPEADWDRLHPVLDAAMRELNERDREAVLLRFFEGHGFAEVGARLNLTENAARMRVDRALDKLRVRLSEHGVTSTAAALAMALASQAVVAAPTGLAAAVTSTALTGAVAAGGGAWAVLQFIAMNKLQIGIASTVIAVAGTGAVLQQQANAQLQREIDALRQENRQIAVLQEENLNLKQTAAEVATLRADDAELAQLGTEATALKVRLQAQAKAQAARNAPSAVGPYVGPSYNLAQADHMPAVRYQVRPVYPPRPVDCRSHGRGNDQLCRRSRGQRTRRQRRKIHPCRIRHRRRRSRPKVEIPARAARRHSGKHTHDGASRIRPFEGRHPTTPVSLVLKSCAR